ncbi:late histone H2B.L4-like [Eupeodes corollae]|uniref:late histone H2B.L4-like n=1 Tax=Eupeodes corollae TaxID=290404 RepID=UPI002491F94D|nr:late histone H2B.L4-like [Eupeodes corollae]
MDQESETNLETAAMKTIPKLQENKLLEIKKKPKTRPLVPRLQFQKNFIRVLRSMKNNDRGLTHNAKCILNSMVNDIFDRLTVQAIQLQRAAKRKTLTHNDMASACSLLFSGDLQKHAKAAGAKAVVQYLRSYKK